MRSIVISSSVIFLLGMSYVCLFKTDAYLDYCHRQHPSGLVRDVLLEPRRVVRGIVRVVGVISFALAVAVIVSFLVFPPA